MVTTDLGASEWFLWDLRQSNLIERDQVDVVMGEFLTEHPGADARAMADYLIERGILTPFQVERLLEGKTDGYVLGQFTLKDALGAGSMGTVYKAQLKTDGKWYAVKVLPRRSVWHVRLARRNVRVFEKLEDPSVVPFVDVGTAGGMHYLAWPLVEGETLARLVSRQGKLTPEQTAAFGVQAAEGLHLCHEQGLFHGFLKPSNLMIGPDGRLRILDFGIGCLVAEIEDESLVDTRSTANSICSGLDCGSPESIMDPTNLTTIGDQYSLGCVLYYCLTGRFPFPEGTTVEKMTGHQFKEPTPIKQLAPDVPDGLIAVLARLMKKAPAERYASAGEAAEALRAFAGPVRTAPRNSGLARSENGSGQKAPTHPPASKPVAAPLPEAPPARQNPPAKTGPVYPAPVVPIAWQAPATPASVVLPPTGLPLLETSPVRPSLSRSVPRLEKKPAQEQDWSPIFYALVVLSIVAGWLLARSGILF